MEKLGNIHRHHWKVHLKFSTVIYMYTATKLRKFIDVCMVGGKFVPSTIQTSLKFRDF